MLYENDETTVNESNIEIKSREGKGSNIEIKSPWGKTVVPHNVEVYQQGLRKLGPTNEIKIFRKQPK